MTNSGTTAAVDSAVLVSREFLPQAPVIAPTLAKRISTFFGEVAAILALVGFVPLAILVVGVPIVLTLRLIVEIVQRLVQ